MRLRVPLFQRFPPPGATSPDSSANIDKSDKRRRGMRVAKYLVTLMAGACVPLLSHAVELKTPSSTQYLWYEDILADGNEQDLAEAFRLNMSKIDKDGKINVYGYGRGAGPQTRG